MKSPLRSILLLCALCLVLCTLKANDTVYVSGAIQHDGLLEHKPWYYGSNSYVDFSVHYLNDSNSAHFHSLRASTRAELTQWPLPGYEPDFKGYGISHISLEANFDFGNFTIGDIYAQFGSGLILNLYEDRSLGIDGALRGAKFDLMPDRGVHLTLLGGKQRRYWNCYKDHAFGWNYTQDAVLGADLELHFESWSHFSFTEPYSDWDMDYLCHLADSLGVAIIGHNETGGNAADYEEQLEDAYAYHSMHGIHAIKTGYVSPIIRTRDGLQLNKGQSGVRHYRHVIETAARYRIAIDNHEPVMPTGLQRTYPNLMTQEGVRGQEWNAWSADGGNPASHVTVLPFTRIMAGPVDFTPGVFAFENPSMPGTRVHSTLMNQLGLFVCLYSPLQMACDLPENYLKYPDAFRFIESVPCDWERSILVDGQIGEFCIFARQERGGDDWFMGGVNNDTPRDITLPLSMLDSHTVYHAVVYRDSDDADWQTNPYGYLIEHIDLTASDTLTFRMASGGGFAIHLMKE